MIGATQNVGTVGTDIFFFQSPIHRGDRCNGGESSSVMTASSSFSPLFIGVIGATPTGPLPLRTLWSFSPLFIGVIGATPEEAAGAPGAVVFQSPIHRGDRCNGNDSGGKYMHRYSFSPLFIGVIGATPDRGYLHSRGPCFQSPIHRGDRCNVGPAVKVLAVLAFQSPIHRGDRCNKREQHQRRIPAVLSVPYSSG